MQEGVAPAPAPRSGLAPRGLRDAGKGCSFAAILDVVDHISVHPGTAFLTLEEGAAILTPGELLWAGWLAGALGVLSLSVMRLRTECPHADDAGMGWPS